MSIDYSQKIPNNVNLAEDRTLQRALEQWQPNFIQWWDDVGPEGSTNYDVYLRTATSVDPQGWAHFDIFSWTPKARPGFPVGAEAQVIRAAYAMLKARFG